MKINENIINVIGNKNNRQSNLLDGQIRAHELIISVRSHQQTVSIERIREMTSSSKISWADAVTEDREDRI